MLRLAQESVEGTVRGVLTQWNQNTSHSMTTTSIVPFRLDARSEGSVSDSPPGALPDAQALPLSDSAWRCRADNRHIEPAFRDAVLASRDIAACAATLTRCAERDG